RIKQLEAANSEAELKVKRVTETLAEETKRREGVEHQAGEIGEQKGKLEAELAEYKQKETKLRQELESARKQQQTQQENFIAERTRFEERLRELQAAKAEVERLVKDLTETLANEMNRRETAEQQAGEIGKQTSKLETELAENKQAQVKLRHELEKAQKQQQAQQQSSGAEQARTEARIKEL